MTTAYINRIATGVPAYDVHELFLGVARVLLGDSEHAQERFDRMSQMAGISHRYSCIDPAGGFYEYGRCPSTAERMRAFDLHAPELAAATVDRLGLGDDLRRITHLLVTCCTGFSAPGVDFQVMERCGLPGSVERVLIGFMGCHAAINALKAARHIVRSEPDSRVLVLNLELCTLHLRDAHDLEEMLGFLLFADGCAASLVTAEPQGIALDSFRALLVPESKDMITWHIGDCGFEMVLSPRVPGMIRRALKGAANEILSDAPAASIDLWAVHPGRHIGGRRGAARPRPQAGSARRIPRRAAQLRQHVFGHRDVRARGDDAFFVGGFRRLRHVVRSGNGRGNDDVPQCGLRSRHEPPARCRTRIAR